MTITLDMVHCHEFFKHNISESGCVSLIMYKGGKVSTQSGPLERVASVTVHQKKL
jgi:hypothetical protein